MEAVICKAKEENGDVDVIVLPECAICEDEISHIEEIFAKTKVLMYVAGVRGENGGQYVNYARIAYWSNKESRYISHKQAKHHRWMLDRSQITRYQLGGRLYPNVKWWENIAISRRQVHFVNFGPELTACALICEDLARQGGVSQLLRDVGPSLAVVLLMDGPQVRERWSARYALVLGDDPGCAVIALTCRGMVDRVTGMKPKHARQVALWSQRGGAITEIGLEEGAVAVLLSLSVDKEMESTIDGRAAENWTASLALTGVTQIYKQLKEKETIA